VVVIARIEQQGGTGLLVAPITHSPPEHAADAVEIDRERSWVVLTELNRFIWPGPDVRPTTGSDDPFYDALPDWLFARVRRGIIDQSRRLKVTKRTD
jgi:hypothetical protein